MEIEGHEVTIKKNSDLKSKVIELTNQLLNSEIKTKKQKNKIEYLKEQNNGLKDKHETFQSDIQKWSNSYEELQKHNTIFRDSMTNIGSLQFQNDFSQPKIENSIAKNYSFVFSLKIESKKDDFLKLNESKNVSKNKPMMEKSVVNEFQNLDNFDELKLFEDDFEYHPEPIGSPRLMRVTTEFSHMGELGKELLLDKFSSNLKKETKLVKNEQHSFYVRTCALF